MPLHLGYDPARAAPALGLVAEAGVETPDLVGRTPHRTLEQMSNPALENGIGGQADDIPVVLRFQEFIDLRRGKPRIGSGVAPLPGGPVKGDDRFQHPAPALGGGGGSRPQSAGVGSPPMVE